MGASCVLTAYMKVRTPSVHTDHTDLQGNFTKASRHGVTTGCALGKDRAREPSLSARSSPHISDSTPPTSLLLVLQALVKTHPRCGLPGS